MLVITGATGQLGSQVIEELLRLQVPAGRIVASVRNPEKAAALAGRGVVVRAGDFTNSTQLPHTFTGAEQVLVISPDKLGEEGRRLSRTAIEAARTAGARRVLYTSHMGAQADSPTQDQAFIKDHAAIEGFLAQAGLPYTALRHGYYAESALHHLGRGLETGEIRVPEDGPVSWTTRADLAEADARIIAQEGLLDGITPPLTALQTFTFAEVAAIASELTGREIKHVLLSDKQWAQEKQAQGVPEHFVELLLSSYRAMRRGEFATVDPTLERILGRRPRTLRDVLADLLQPTAV
ncbi:SDR family oxidoreductase [Hymenobacter taeanensis]|uniref:SDR family oxidoreductase n=1 Tax=Hymenobacter taeanensis TaxID=2735321 RepID=A0A6M6BMN5_9BACT|nr:MULTISPECIES: SDR family oxidoreductase [Hymenobacter]QJX49074.1 SDR family oxidoreductase [Hymenobacter taeanensis]UOQ81405.1 SDR family oxidoreductase [Hymenobacter sp. 5414T-23]